MFGRRETYNFDTSNITNITVKEASSADHARLYGELLEKARAEVLETFVVSNEVMTGGHIVFYRGVDQSYLGAVIGYKFTFSLNGKRYEGSGSVPHDIYFSDHMKALEEALSSLYERLVKTIVQTMVENSNIQELARR